MKRITIIYKGVQEFRGTITFEAEQIFFKTHHGYKEIGYLEKGKTRKTWLPIGGKLDETNDYSETEVIIENL